MPQPGPHAAITAGAVRVVLWTALAYAAAGALALALTGPGGYAAALYPPAGIALAASLVFGRPTWIGIWLGSFAVNLGLGWMQAGPGAKVVALAAVIAAGATLQAVVGAALVRRFVAWPLVLIAPRDLLRASLGGAAIACVVSASVATSALLLGGSLDPGMWTLHWLTWWAGDALGVLITAPLVLTVIGQPAADWRARQRTVGLPLLLALAMLTWATAQFQASDQERIRIAFERDVDRLASETQARLRLPLYALQALHGAALAHGSPSQEVLREGARWGFAQPRLLQAVGYSERVAAIDLASFEARAGAEQASAFEVFQRDEGKALAGDGEAVVVRRIHPMDGNRGALGVNALSIPAARSAILAARDSGQPRATAAFRLTQSTREENGLVLYQALFDGQQPEPQDPATRVRQFRGVLFVTVRVEPMLSELKALAPKGMAWCVVEANGDAAATQLAGTLPCTGASRVAGFHQHPASRPLEFGGRSLELRVARQGDAAAIDQAGAWLFSLTGVAAAAMLGALLLVVTGQARRTEVEVQSATSELRHEVAERRQAELALRQSEAQLRSILDNVPLGVAFLDAHGALLEGNPRLFEMLGSPPPALLGRRVDEITLPDDQADMQRQHLELLAGRIEVARGEARLQRGDGQRLWVRLAASAQRDAEGRVQRMIAVVEDIGEHRRLEAAELAVHRAEAANRAKTEFVSRMSHELRTPLNAMIGFAQLLGLDVEPALPTHQREWTQEIQRAGWHLLELINETLDLARIESGTIQVSLQPVPLAPMLANCRAMVAGAAAMRRMVVGDSLDDKPTLAALADPVRLRQVLTNLLSNAVKYNRDGGQVTIRAAAADACITIEVEDSGIGMTPSQLDRLFVPYDRLGREDSGIEGTGIGLVISRRLTELMGGTLEAVSRPDQGTIFTVTLPAATSPADAIRADGATTRADAPHQHVLYIEDNPTNVEVMRGILGQRSQVQLDVAMLGLDGLVAARRQHPDLILLDMQLPDISGLELLRMLKNDDDLAGIPVIVVSADATPARVRDALTLGAILYLTKPVDLTSMLQAVDDVLEGRPSRWNHSV